MGASLRQALIYPVDNFMQRLEVTSVSESEIIAHYIGTRGEPGVIRYFAFGDSNKVNLLGQDVKLLKKPKGKLLSSFVTINDIHIGEKECGKLGNFKEVGPVLRAEEGELAYPSMMARFAANEIKLLNPDALIAKGDLTDSGRPKEIKEFLEIFSSLGIPFYYTLGNHDTIRGDVSHEKFQVIKLEGVSIILLDTTIPFDESGTISDEQLEYIADMASGNQRVILMGHHHLFNPGSKKVEKYFGVDYSSSAKLVEVMKKMPNIKGYFAGHSHRNRVRYFSELGRRPIVEVAALKDFPGVYAYYKVYEEAILQICLRVSAKKALVWGDKCRQLYAGLYEKYAFGNLTDRCLAF